MQEKLKWDEADRLELGNIPARLFRPRPVLFAARVGGWLLLLVAGVIGIGYTAGGYQIVLQIFVGVVIAYGVELSHQCLHRSGFGVAAFDHLIGIILSIPAGRSYWWYRHSHLQHHKFNGTPSDPERPIYMKLYHRNRMIRLWACLVHFSAARSHLAMVKRVLLTVTGQLPTFLSNEEQRMPERIQFKIVRDYWLILAFLFTVVVVSWESYLSGILDLWLLPLLIGYGPTHAAIILPEHFLCEYPNASPFSNTRCIRAGIVGRWFTNFNSNHVGHHLHPGIPLENVPEFEDILRNRKQFLFEESSYPHFYAAFLIYVWTGRTIPKRALPQGDCPRD